MWGAALPVSLQDWTTTLIQVHSSKLEDLQRNLLSLEVVTDKSVDVAIWTLKPINIPRFTLEDRLPAIERTFQARSLSLGYLRRTPITLMCFLKPCFRSVEEILANLGKEDSQWARENLDKLSKMSPTSLKVTFKQFQNAAGGMSLDQVGAALQIWSVTISVNVCRRKKTSQWSELSLEAPESASLV